MSECKRIITPNTICTESALDAVCKLVADGMKVTPACKFVAEEYQKNYPEDKAEWETLKKQYYRANTSTKKNKNQGHVPDSEVENQGHVPDSEVEKELISLAVPMYTEDKVDNTQLNAALDELDFVKEENKSLHSIITKQNNTIKVLEAKLIKAHEEIESLRYTIKSQEPYIFKCMELNIQIDLPVEEEQILLTRTEIVETIEQYGEGFQPMILKKDKTTNLELFNVLVAIRNRFEENKSIIPNPLSERVRLAVGPEPEEDIGTLKSLPRSNIKA